MTFVTNTNRRLSMMTCETNRKLHVFKNSVVQAVQRSSSLSSDDEKVGSSKEESKRRTSLQNQKEMVRHELAMRTEILINDTEEFRRMQAQIRKSGVLTGVGALQVLDGRVTHRMLKAKAARSA